MSEKEEGSVEDDGREREGVEGGGQTVGWLEPGKPEENGVSSSWAPELEGVVWERQSQKRWREAACGYCPFAFVDLLELIYSLRSGFLLYSILFLD